MTVIWLLLSIKERFKNNFTLLTAFIAITLPRRTDCQIGQGH